MRQFQEYQTLGGHSCRPSEELGAPTTSLEAPGTAGEMSASTSNHSYVFSLYSHLCIYVSAYRYSISNDPNFCLKHPGVPDGSDSSDGTSYALMENYMLPVAQVTGRVAYVHPLLCGDIYASSERHV